MSAPALDTAAAAAALAAGRVLLLATDTICGLHARADRPEALARVLALKGRAPEQPLLLLAASLDQARGLCAPLTAAQAAHCAAAWPGPFTFLLPARPDLPAAVCDAARATVAVRVPGRSDLRRLVELAGAPLASTSANRTGEPALTTLPEALAAFGGGVDGWWEGEGAASRLPGAPSALVDLTTEPPRVLRAGPLAWTGAGPPVS